MIKNRYFLHNILFLLSMLGLVACSGKSNDNPSSASSSVSQVTYTESISGKAEKGPFQLGSVVKITELDTSFQATNNFFVSVIHNELGEYRIPISVSNPLIKVEVTGKIFNELTSSISSKDVTLTAYVDLRHDNKVNVNVLTHLASKRFLNYVTQGHATDEALQLATNTVLLELGLNQNLSTSLHQLELNNSLIDNRELLGATAFILSTANQMVNDSRTFTDALTELLNNMVNELATGKLSDATKLQYESGKQFANLETFKNNFKAYLVNLNVTPNLPMTIGLPNRVPIASAGGNMYGALGSNISLNGSISSDIDGNGLTFHWKLVTAPTDSLATIVEPTNSVASMVLDKVGDYTVSLTVNDGISDSVASEVKISTTKVPPQPKLEAEQFAIPNGQPFIISAANSLNVNESVLRYRWYVVGSILDSSSRASLIGEGQTLELIPTHTGTTWYALMLADEYFDFPLAERYIGDIPQATYFKISVYDKFNINGDGTVSSANGKFWQQSAGDGLLYSMIVESHLQPDETKTAPYYCNNLELAGKLNWRIPTYGELSSLVDHRYASPTIDQTIFSASTNHPYIANFREGNITQWGIDFNTGELHKGSNQDLMYYVRCIHD